MYDARSGWRQTLGASHAPSVAGALAAAAAFAANELFSGLAYGGPSLLVAVAAKIIDFSPKVAKDLAIAVFGTNDKLALAVMILVVGIGFGVGLGAASSYRFWMGQLGFGLFAILGRLRVLLTHWSLHCLLFWVQPWPGFPGFRCWRIYSRWLQIHCRG